MCIIRMEIGILQSRNGKAQSRIEQTIPKKVGGGGIRELHLELHGLDVLIALGNVLLTV